jgi:hypothetical protein
LFRREADYIDKVNLIEAVSKKYEHSHRPGINERRIEKCKIRLSRRRER